MGYHADVIVIGGGPSGSSAAYALAKSGCDVLVLEKAVMPRHKLCGGGITEQALHYLPFEVPQDLHEAVCYGARLEYGGRQIEVAYHDRIAILTNRARFDEFLLDQAVEQGARVEWLRAKGLDVSGNGVEVATKDGPRRAAMAIVAAGASTPLIRTVRDPDPEGWYGICMEADFPRGNPDPRSDLGNLVGVSFDVCRFGYGWVFPHGDYYNVGIGGLRAYMPEPREAMRTFCRNHGFDPDATKLRGWPIPCGGHPRRNSAARVLLAGDSAGFVDPFYGEGIAYAIRSGQLAAEVAADALSAGDFSGTCLRRYDARCTREFGRDLTYALAMTNTFHRFLDLFANLFVTQEDLLRKYLEVPQRTSTYKRFLLWAVPRLPWFMGRERFQARRLMVTGK